MESNLNRRQHARVALNLLVQTRVDDFDAFMENHASNISAGGMFLAGSETRPVGSMIYFKFSLPEGSALIEGLGRVVRVIDDGMGIEFVGLEEKTKAVIERIIQDRIQSSKSG